MKEDPNYPGDLAQAFSVVHRAFYNDTKQQYQHFQLNPTSAYILVFLSRQGDSNQTTLARRLVINKGQITREVQHLVELGFVIKTVDQYKKTANHLSLSSAGKSLIPQILAIRETWWQERLKLNGLQLTTPFAEALTAVTQELIHRQDSARITPDWNHSNSL